MQEPVTTQVYDGQVMIENPNYDGSANCNSDPVCTRTNDAEKYLTALTTTIAGAYQIQNTYDSDETPSGRAIGSAATHFVGDSFEADPIASTMTEFYPLNGVVVAMKKNGVLSYLHRDHLGSMVAATDSSGNEQCSVRYAPFGSIRSSSGTLVTDRLFTGQVRNNTSDAFYFFKARYYDATIGKFQTADSIAPEAGKPRALNWFAYAANNPLRFNDPTGHRPAE